MHDALLLIDKPKGWSSFDVVKKLRNTLKVKKIGHGGTLDPLATGLLLVGVGKYTKKLNEIQGLDKSYDGIIELGKTTPSYDLETDFDTVNPTDHLTAKMVMETRDSFLGQQNQLPPIYSAIKVNGERAYKKARRKETAELRPRMVHIHRFDVDCNDLPLVRFHASVSKGTYVRSLAHDFGMKLQVGGYLKELRRVSIGPYLLENAQSIEDVIKDTNESN